MSGRHSVAGAVLVVLLAACTAQAPTSDVAAGSGGAPAGASQSTIEGSTAVVPGGSPTAAVTGAGSAAGSSQASGASGGTAPVTQGSAPPGAPEIAWDPGLLDVLPPVVAGLDRTPQPDAFADVKTDAALGKDVAAMAMAAYSGDDDLASVSVARLKPGAFGEEFFRAWRDTYDSAACARVGGVNGHAEATIAGHDTFITSCRRLILAYHLHLGDPDRVVSLFAVGPRRLGEELLAHIGG